MQYKMLIIKLDRGARALRASINIWEDNNKIHFKETVCKDVD